jgi:transposase
MSNILGNKYFCVSDSDYSNILDKFQDNNLSEEDKAIILHILINHRHIMKGLVNGSIKGKELEKQIKKLSDEAKKNNQNNSSEERLRDFESSLEANNAVKNSGEIKSKSDSNSIENTENNSNIQNNKNPQNNEPGKIKPKSNKKKKKQKKKKSGKRGHGQFSSAEDKRHMFDPDFMKNSSCPCCGENNKLYPIVPAVTVLFSGNSPIVPKAHLTEKARCSSCGVTVAAQVPVEVENSVGRFLPSAVAQLAIQRFSLGFPHSRMETLTNLYGIHIPDSNQWSVIETVAMEMEPLFELLATNVANAKWVGIDDATARVVDLRKEIQAEIQAAKDEQEARTGFQSTINENDFRRGIQSTVFVAKTFSDHNVVYYITGRNHQGENKAAVLELRTNPEPIIIMSDAAKKALMKIKSNNGIKTIDTNCLEHFRLKIEEIEKNYPKETKHLLAEIAKVYKNDAHCKKEGLDDLQRLAYHQKYSEPIMTKLKNFIENELKENSRAEPNGHYVKKVLNYATNHWPRLTGFLKYCGAEIDNNSTERETKPVVRYRDNSEKYLTEHGASVGDFYMSIIETCKLNNINTRDYLEFCITYRKFIPDDPELFLPWNYLETKKEFEEELNNRSRYRIVSQRGAYIPKAETLRAQ